MIYVHSVIARFASAEFIQVTHPSVQTQKSVCGRSDGLESDPPHKIVRYWFYYSTQLPFSFLSDQIGRAKFFVPVKY